MDKSTTNEVNSSPKLDIRPDGLKRHSSPKAEQHILSSAHGKILRTTGWATTEGSINTKRLK